MTTKTRPESWPHQERALEFITERRGAMLAMEMGTGKDLDDRTPIPTPQGWTLMGKIQAGQQVFDETGAPCAVTRVFPQGERPTYEVEFDDGSIITAGEEHLWMTLTHSHQAEIHKGARSLDGWASSLMPITTLEIASSLIHRRGTLEESMHSIPTAGALQLPDAELPIDPYILGVWLGDGSSRDPDITCHQDDEPHHREEVLAAGEAWRVRNRRGNVLTTMARGEKPLMVHRLAELGIRGDRQIPERYLRASMTQRTRLLHGLMGQGGYIDPRNGHAEYTTTSEKLAHGVLELLLSLGQKATMTTSCAKLEGRKISDKWRIIFSPSIQATSLPRKKAAQAPYLENRNSLVRADQRYIRNVKPAGVRKTTCITVDSPSGLFLAGREMIPTHNTRVAIDLMDETQSQNTLVLCPLSVADHVWEDQIETHARRGYQVVPLGSRAGTVKKKAETFRKEFEKARILEIPLVVVVNYESAWREPLASILKSIRWNLLVMDESHRLKSPSGQASRFASQVADRSLRRLALTGTPMPHSPLDIYAQYRAVDKGVFGVDYRRFKDYYTVSDEINVPTSRKTRARTGKETQEIKRTIGYKNEDELNSRFHSLAFVVAAHEVLDLPETINSYRRVPLAPRARRIHNQLEDEFQAEVADGRITNAANALTKLLRLQQVTSGFAVAENEETMEEEVVEVDHAKADALADIMADLPEGENLVVFARFLHDLDVIRRVAEKDGRDFWELSGRRRELDDWKREGGVLATQIQTGSIGIDMTQARYCVYYSLGYSLGDYLQSRARVHRPGQTRDVYYIHLIAAGTVDEQVMKSLHNKEDVIERILRVKGPKNMEKQDWSKPQYGDL